MEKFVTLAVHTREKAQYLQHVLKAHGIECYTEEVSTIFPSLSIGSRIKVKDGDLQRAVSITEDMSRMEIAKEAVSEIEKKKVVMMPFDFSQHSLRVLPLAFSWAKRLGAEVCLFHTFPEQEKERHTMLGKLFEPGKEEENAKRKELIEEEKKKAEELDKTIKQRIADGELDDAPYKFDFVSGVPEEQIIETAEKTKPYLIVMGTRSNQRKEEEMIGSVAAEVTEDAPVPVFALPENVEIENAEKIKNVAFVTNFDDRDFEAFDKLMTRLSFQKVSVFLAHINSEEKADAWDEIKLGGIKNYFAEHYDADRVEYSVLMGGTKRELIKEYIEKNSIDVVALSTRRRTMMAKIFYEGMARSMVFQADVPTFVFHAK